MENKTEDGRICPVSVKTLTEWDIRNATFFFDDDVRDILAQINWDRDLLCKIAEKLRERYFADFREDLPYVIKDVLKDEIKKAKEKDRFFDGVRRFLKERKGEK